MRYSFFILLVLQVSLVRADWTGVAMEFSNLDADWQFDEGLRKTDASEISFQIEERTDSNLSVGAGIGYFSTRVGAGGSSTARRFEGQFFRIGLRQDLGLTESVSLTGALAFRYNSGNTNQFQNRVDIDWNQVDLELAINFQFSSIRMSPFVYYQDVDGDVSDDDATELFKSDDPGGQGIRFDYFMDRTAFIRFELRSGAQSGGLLTFARRY